MNLLIQIFIIFGFSLSGELIASTLPVVIPGSILGLVLLYAALSLKLIKVTTIEPTASYLKDNMAFLFIPLTVGLMEAWGVFESILLPLILIVFVSTIATMAISATITQRLAVKAGNHE